MKQELFQEMHIPIKGEFSLVNANDLGSQFLMILVAPGARSWSSGFVIPVRRAMVGGHTNVSYSRGTSFKMRT